MNRLILLLAFTACDSHVFTTVAMVDGEAGAPSAQAGSSGATEFKAGVNPKGTTIKAGAPSTQGGTTEAGSPTTQGGITEAGAPTAQGGTTEAGASNAQTTISASGSPSTGQAGTTSGNATAGAAGQPMAPKACLVEMTAGCVVCDTTDPMFKAECLGLLDCWRVNGCGPQDICSKAPKVCSGRNIEVLIAANATFECTCGGR